ncbi:MAG: hydrolase TatD [Candidatus Niyogibacteria bacterium CG10_big_fil_rev_8_21_14_0_10_46_36]|uniref:Hydrolase TatD n=1 Tax=Candidatus Niyogibacteria bacterium CG10_big_fil_rev_8_21_14_0_10_46_36 TaxID=1974726 RepID=A0A2H0TGC7_9BACT|nr:MAG: hydrolase TatD [Candidatus Niyogibacteria bacterium CG10_big_fil_rev_8_21_14_0_10_46_36]
MIDSHTHMQFAAFKDDVSEVIWRARGKGIWIINVGTQKDTSKQAVALAEQYEDGVYATVGLHPIHTDASYHDPQELGGGEGFTSRGEEFSVEEYTELARHPKVVAIGECGLDYYRIEGDIDAIKEKQKNIFRKHIDIAKAISKPLMIHCRPSKKDDAYRDIIEILREKSATNGVVHFFVGSREVADEFLSLGFSFTFGGVITFVHDYDKVARHIPLDRILSETDAPYVTPAPHRGKRNEPAYVEEVVKKIAELKEVSFEGAARQTVLNAKEKFGV